MFYLQARPTVRPSPTKPSGSLSSTPTISCPARRTVQIAHPTDCKKFIKCYSGKLSGFCLRWKARNYLLIPLILVVGIITSSLEIHSTNQNIRFISKYVGKKVIVLQVEDTQFTPATIITCTTPPPPSVITLERSLAQDPVIQMDRGQACGQKGMEGLQWS